MPDVKIYTTRMCGYCRMALRLLDEKGVAYEQIDVTGDHQQRLWLREASGRHTVPQVFIDGEPVGGYTDLLALDRAGELDKKLQRASGAAS